MIGLLDEFEACTLEVIPIGNSKGVILPYNVLRTLKVDLKDTVKLYVKKANG